MEYCDVRPHVLRWASEELAIPYYFQGTSKWHRYFPDFLLHVKVQNQVETWMVEVKPSRQTQQPSGNTNKRRHLKEVMEYAKNQAKWTAATEYCQAKGWKFIILTEKDLYPNAK